MTNKKIIEFVREALTAHKNGELNEGPCVIAISAIVNTTKVTKDDIEWSKKVLVNMPVQ